MLLQNFCRTGSTRERHDFGDAVVHAFRLRDGFDDTHGAADRYEFRNRLEYERRTLEAKGVRLLLKPIHRRIALEDRRGQLG